MNRATWAWCLYDWANSALPTVVTTFVFAAYFAKAVVGDETEGTFLWGQATAAAGLLVAVTGPVLGAVADRAGRRKPWIGGFTLVAVLACAGLWFVAPDRGYIALALGLVIVTTAAFEFASVFYNAMLPDLVAANRLGRVSGWGWGIGFLGGLSALALVLVVFVNPAAAPFGLDKGAAEHIRAAMVAAALWFAVFALPLFLFTGEASGPRQPLAAAARAGLGDLWRTLRTVRRQPQLLRFLLARMAYADGLATLFALGGIYAAGTFAMDFDEIILFAIALNVTAGLGAIAFAWLDD
ncbi:MAG: MFS transporter, partial [Pseudomonadota bacterium]|nr:MFS transporter [Pseudomonadota bacterium]